MTLLAADYMNVLSGRSGRVHTPGGGGVGSSSTAGRTSSTNDSANEAGVGGRTRSRAESRTAAATPRMTKNEVSF